MPMVGRFLRHGVYPSTKKWQNVCERPVTDDISRRDRSGLHYTSLTLVYHGVKVSEDY